MKRLSRNSVVIAAGLLLTAFSLPRIDIKVSRVDGHQRVGLSQKWGFVFSRKRAPCVDMIDLRAGEGAMSVSAWRLEAEGSGCLRLAGFTIGEVPAGFVEVNRLPAQSRGPFRLFVRGIGSGETPITLP